MFVLRVKAHLMDRADFFSLQSKHGRMLSRLGSLPKDFEKQEATLSRNCCSWLP